MDFEILYWICFTGFILFFSNAVSMILSNNKKIEGHLSVGLTFITGVLTILFMVTSVITFISNIEMKSYLSKKKIPPIEQKYSPHSVELNGDTTWKKVKDTIPFNFNNYLKIK